MFFARPIETDPIKAYQLSEAVARKVRFCGYLGVESRTRSPHTIYEQLGVGSGKLVLVTVGGIGLDVFPVLDVYLNPIESLPKGREIHSVFISGSEWSTGRPVDGRIGELLFSGVSSTPGAGARQGLVSSNQERISSAGAERGTDLG